jgi:thioredoxin-like negative regulator of GroEL
VLAVEDATATLAVEPDNIKAYYRRAKAQQALGETQAALDDVSKLLAIDGKNAAARTLLMELKAAGQP